MLISGSGFFIVIAALAFDALIGDPDWLWRRPGHPVAWIGALIGALDRRFNREDRRNSGEIFGHCRTAAWSSSRQRRAFWFKRPCSSFRWGIWRSRLIASIFIAQRSLYEHVARVRRAFVEGGLDTAAESRGHDRRT